MEETPHKTQRQAQEEALDVEEDSTDQVEEDKQDSDISPQVVRRGRKKIPE